ncbi:MAG: hypothetical protein ABI616_01675 [Pseudomonadota bacterium]
MNIKRNTLTIVAGVLLVASLPTSAQVLGGGLTGTANGMLGGSFGAAGMQGAGSGAGNAGLGTADSFGMLHDRASQAAGRTRDTAASKAADAHSRVDTVRGTSDATAQAAHSATVNGAKSGEPASQTGVTGAQPGDDLLLGGSASAQKHAMGHNASAHAATDSATTANSSGLGNNSNGQAGLAVTKDEPAPATDTSAR